jgi:Ca-activated chloride channel family protein
VADEEMIAQLPQFQFAHPEWLLLIPALLFLQFWIRRRLHRALRIPGTGDHKKPHYLHTRYHELASLVAADQKKTIRLFTHLRQVLLFLAFSLMIVALSQPVWMGKQLPDPPQDRDIMFVVDTSVNMTLRDYMVNNIRVDRMTLLKGVITRFIEQLHGEKLSIIVYGERAHTLTPFTRDHALVKHMLGRISTGLAGRSNAMGEALAHAVRQSETATENKRIIILFTDGSRPTGKIPPEAAMELARLKGIKIYTVGIGAGSNEASEKKYSGLVYNPVDIERLKLIAQHTGAKFYWAGDTQQLDLVIRDIERTERNQRKPEPRFIMHPLYSWPLLLGILLILALQIPSLRVKQHV